MLFGEDHGQLDVNDRAKLAERAGLACGFYWTEGNTGLGWAVDAIPTLKASSTIGIPSPPAIWRPGSGRVLTPDLRDAERLQGFPADWTQPGDETPAQRKSFRWRLVGNAVSVPVANWIGQRLRTEGEHDSSLDSGLGGRGRWPCAAWGRSGERYEVDVSTWPVAEQREHLHEFLEYEPEPLSIRATSGFLRRALASKLRIPEDLICEAEAHLAAMTDDVEAAA